MSHVHKSIRMCTAVPALSLNHQLYIADHSGASTPQTGCRQWPQVTTIVSVGLGSPQYGVTIYYKGGYLPICKYVLYVQWVSTYVRRTISLLLYKLTWSFILTIIVQVSTYCMYVHKYCTYILKWHCRIECVVAYCTRKEVTNFQLAHKWDCHIIISVSSQSHFKMYAFTARWDVCKRQSIRGHSPTEMVKSNLQLKKWQPVVHPSPAAAVGPTPFEMELGSR